MVRTKEKTKVKMKEKMKEKIRTKKRSKTRLLVGMNFPLELFKSYFPYTENQEIKFVNGETESIVFTINESEYTYKEFRADPGDDCMNQQTFGYNVILTDSHSDTLTLAHSVTWYADDWALYYCYNMRIDYLDKGYRHSSGHQKPENILNDLTDNIKVSCNEGSYRGDYFIIAAGKGIVEFMIDGEKYTLVEE